MKAMNKDKVYRIILTVLCILCICCMFLPLLDLDLVAASELVSRVFKNEDFALDREKWNMFAVLSKMYKVSKQVKPYIVISAIFGFLPYLITLVILGLSWVKKRGAAIASAVLAVANAILIFVMHYIVAPDKIEFYSAKKIHESVVGLVTTFVAKDVPEGSAAQLASLYKSALSWAFFVPIILMLAVFAVSLIRALDAAPADVYRPMMLGIGGMYAGARFPIEPGAAIVIGRSPDQSHVILERPDISRMHCSVVYEAESGMFRIDCLSRQGIFVSGCDGVVFPGNPQMVPAGTMIALGAQGEERFQLL